MSKQTTKQRLAQINGVAPQTINEAFTKQHYIAIAKVISDARGTSDDDARTIAAGLAEIFARDNSQFRREQFLTACGF